MPVTRGGRGYWTGRQPRHQGRGGQTQRPYNGGTRKEGYSYAQAAAVPGQANSEQDQTNSALASMAEMLKGILLRLTVLEGRGPDTARPAPFGANDTTSKPAPLGASNTRTGPRQSTDTFKSNNINFSAVCKNIYRSVQLEHHLSNWSKLPEKLDKRLQSFVSDIKPPMGDEHLRIKLKTLTDEYSNNLCDTVRRHLEEQTILNEVAASTLNKQDAERAVEVADRYITSRLKKKIPQDRKQQLLMRAMNKIGTLLPGQQTAGPSTSTSVQVEPKKQQDRVSQVGGNTKKQVKVSSPPQQVICSNRFDGLNYDQDNDCINIVDDDDVDLETSEPDSPIVSHTPKRLKRTNEASVEPPGKLQVHYGPKTHWKLQVSAKASTLIIGDSNLRQVDRTNLPSDWEVHAFPGATFDHITQMAQRDLSDVRLDHLVIQVGINHRDNHPQVTKQSFNQLENVICGLKLARNITFCGVTTPGSMNGELKQRIKDLNDNIISKTGCGYLAPLPDEIAVCSKPQDPFDIHYNKETVEDLLANIHNYINNLN